MSYLKVKNRDGLYRDTNSNAILNDNVSDFDRYIENRKKMIKNNERVEDLEQSFQDMKNDLDDIKNLLKKLANGQ
jgi:predicted transcriptional regulator|tara:strand:- start:574 stop:798 length:225 start_codon:yes stop_codon:yes gene_type:complete